MHFGEGTMVLSDYAKRILTLWKEGFGPTIISEILESSEGIRTTRKKHFTLYSKVMQHTTYCDVHMYSIHLNPHS